MGTEPEPPPGPLDLGVLRTPRGLLLVAELDLLRAVSGTIIFLVVALVALAASRDALAATTFTFGLILSFLFAFDVFVTYRTQVAPALAQDHPPETT
ncbi:CKLF-like MARVEL transmembrane domain-containing protein 5 isoform X2 [Chroicocephalus ridibundus]|uniref:CKLF-like MARVEL transmembrane domain-containing protein 5 isoform X2 n=1 Tax=Chroicocephalus ridibundus TaxID=1192867 RepID=UPI002FDED417